MRKSRRDWSVRCRQYIMKLEHKQNTLDMQNKKIHVGVVILNISDINIAVILSIFHILIIFQVKSMMDIPLIPSTPLCMQLLTIRLY